MGSHLGPCPVCQHPARTAIEADLVSGSRLASVSADYGLTRFDLGRHRGAHLSNPMAAAMAVGKLHRRAQRGTATPDQLEALRCFDASIERKLQQLARTLYEQSQDKTRAPAHEREDPDE